MSIHAGIFIYDREVIVFVDDIDREIFGHELHVLDLPLDTYDISPIYLFIFREVRSVAVYLPLFDHLLEIASGLLGKKSRQVSVDSSGFSWVREDTEL